MSNTPPLSDRSRDRDWLPKLHLERASSVARGNYYLLSTNFFKSNMPAYTKTATCGEVRKSI